MTGQTFDTRPGGFKDFKFSEGMGTYGVTHCGEDSNGYFDRAGEYFRAGVDPRNYRGRFLPDFDPEPLRFRLQTRKVDWTDAEKREYLQKIMASRRDILNANAEIRYACERPHSDAS
jgi:hypothetical protein